MSEADRGYKDKYKFDKPSEFKKWKSPYQFDSEELDILQKENISPIYTQTFDLTVAQTPQQPLILTIPGRSFRITGLTKATIYNPTTNAGIETAVTTVFLGCFIFTKNGQMNSVNDPSQSIFIKHGGGYRGDFISLGFYWPVQASNAARIHIYKYDGVPWQNGDAGT